MFKFWFQVEVKQLQLSVLSALAYSHSDADVLNQSLLEANIATEVCLTVLDTLSIFIMGFKVTDKSMSHRFTVFELELSFLKYAIYVY